MMSLGKKLVTGSGEPNQQLKLSHGHLFASLTGGWRSLTRSLGSVSKSHPSKLETPYAKIREKPFRGFSRWILTARDGEQSGIPTVGMDLAAKRLSFFGLAGIAREEEKKCCYTTLSHRP